MARDGGATARDQALTRNVRLLGVDWAYTKAFMDVLSLFSLLSTAKHMPPSSGLLCGVTRENGSWKLVPCWIIVGLVGINNRQFYSALITGGFHSYLLVYSLMSALLILIAVTTTTPHNCPTEISIPSTIKYLLSHWHAPVISYIPLLLFSYYSCTPSGGIYLHVGIGIGKASGTLRGATVHRLHHSSFTLHQPVFTLPSAITDHV